LHEFLCLVQVYFTWWLDYHREYWVTDTDLWIFSFYRCTVWAGSMEQPSLQFNYHLCGSDSLYRLVFK